ncbi:MAG: hypothetical protein KGJ37_06310, partial [Verrucomicrobiota bacterium]|nr:hypothetical protein [Verrucomicrobiota bacterium]
MALDLRKLQKAFTQRRDVKRFILKLNKTLEARWLQVVLLLLLGIIYTWAYATHPLFPGRKSGSPTGWWSWADQARYLKAAAALAQFKLSPDVYHYPLGYSLLGAVFWRFMPRHPFFIPDLLLVLGAGYVWWRLAGRLLNKFQSLVLAGLCLLTHGTLLKTTLVIPWNTIPTQFALLAGIWIVISEAGPR